MMEEEVFCEKIKEKANNIGINLNNRQQKQFYDYMKLLLEWNEKINLTAITEPNEIIEKHFIDSMTILKHIKQQSCIADIGTGAGFPGIPLKIAKEDAKVTLIDSLNKRINFLDEVIKELGLEKINAIHSRAEEIGKNKKYRESFDVVTSRAVAKLNVLAEYMLPLVKIGGICICMKGSELKNEIKTSKNAIKFLGGKINAIEEFELPKTDIKRTLVVIEKIGQTPAKYPRKPGTPIKEPIN